MITEIDGELTDGESRKQQLAVRDILALTAAIALLFAYARSFGATETNLAIRYLAMAGTAGVLVGLTSKHLLDILFWSGLVSLLVYLAVAGGRLPNFATAVGWGAVGACCGTFCGWDTSRERIWWSTLLCGGIALVAMLAAIVVQREPLTGLMLFDVACAGVVGMILKPFVAFLQWMEAKSGQPRVVLAAWLTVVMLLGNFLVPVLTGVQR